MSKSILNKVLYSNEKNSSIHSFSLFLLKLKCSGLQSCLLLYRAALQLPDSDKIFHLHLLQV